MSSYSFSFTPLPPVSSGGCDVQVEMTSPVEGDTTVVEVKRASLSPPTGHHLEIDRVLLDARSRIAAITGFGMQEVTVNAYARGYAL